MKLTGVFAMLMAVFTLFVGTSNAAPKPQEPCLDLLKKGAETAESGIKMISAAYELLEQLSKAH